MTSGQKTKSPAKNASDEQMYEIGESVFPKNANSAGLVAITFEGKSNPHKSQSTAQESTINAVSCLAGTDEKIFANAISQFLKFFLPRKNFKMNGAKMKIAVKK
ncbi:MAG: hypothetical protein K2N58_12150 [Treponemataceae bacterium]|nr:hypothetical protein [Treponemataceae bacterium]